MERSSSAEPRHESEPRKSKQPEMQNGNRAFFGKLGSPTNLRKNSVVLIEKVKELEKRDSI